MKRMDAIHLACMLGPPCAIILCGFIFMIASHFWHLAPDNWLGRSFESLILIETHEHVHLFPDHGTQDWHEIPRRFRHD